MTRALRDLLEQEEARRRADRQAYIDGALALVSQMQENWKPETRHLSSVELIDQLYDDQGLPL